MKKTVVVMLLVLLSLIFALAVSPFNAVADGNVKIIQGDEGAVLSGYTLDEGFDVEISFLNYVLYSSGMYRAFTITFDREFWTDMKEVGGESASVGVMTALKLLFSGRWYNITTDAENARFVAEIEFESMTDFYIAMGINGYEYEKSAAEEHKGFLFNEYINKSNTVFSGIEDEGNILTSVLEICNQVGVKNEAVLLNYTYGTPYKIITTDADKMTYSSGQKIYLHSYDMTLETKDREITLIQRSPNTIGWYILAGIAGLIVACIIFVVYYLIKKKGRG